LPHRKACWRAGRAAPLARAGRRALVRLAAGLAVARSVLYIPWIFDDLAFRVGNPGPLDVVMGSS
jgi:TRAP-type uncharacterized transport system fused permease subunit